MNRQGNHIKNHQDFSQEKSETCVQKIKIFIEEIKICIETIINH